MEELSWSQEIETRRLKLRELYDSDVDFVYSHFSDENVCKYLYDAEPLTNIEGAQEIINWYKKFESIDHCRWGLEYKQSGVLIGTCGFHQLDKQNNIIEIGYDLGKNYWGQGYMKEALEAIIDEALNRMKLNRIQAYVYVENESSYKLLESLKFVREGVVRDKHFYRGKYYDHFCYSLLARDLRGVSMK